MLTMGPQPLVLGFELVSESEALDSCVDALVLWLDELWLDDSWLLLLGAVLLVLSGVVVDAALDASALGVLVSLTSGVRALVLLF